MNLLDELPDHKSVYFRNDFHNVMVSHFPNIRTKGKFRVQEISGGTAELFRGDFHGLLKFLRIPLDYHRVNTEFNKMLSTHDYLGNTGTISIIENNYLERLATIFKARM